MFNFIFINFACSEASIQSNDAIIEFENIEFDFKQLKYEENAECFFEFSNSSNSILIIQNVSTSCGCTVSEWPKEPIIPKQNGKIKIKV
ncbi:MAG: DUF1573 domain-containing protein [Bacteroidales bacterium]|nr:DUF1573 domain-containing protein [Bacteroidales bacterium]